MCVVRHFLFLKKIFIYLRKFNDIKKEEGDIICRRGGDKEFSGSLKCRHKAPDQYI